MFTDYRPARLSSISEITRY